MSTSSPNPTPCRHITFHKSTRIWMSESIEAANNRQTKRLHESRLELSWRDGLLHIFFKATDVTVRGPIELVRPYRIPSRLR